MADQIDFLAFQRPCASCNQGLGLDIGEALGTVTTPQLASWESALGRPCAQQWWWACPTGDKHGALPRVVLQGHCERTQPPQLDSTDVRAVGILGTVATPQLAWWA